MTKTGARECKLEARRRKRKKKRKRSLSRQLRDGKTRRKVQEVRDRKGLRLNLNTSEVRVYERM